MLKSRTIKLFAVFIAFLALVSVNAAAQGNTRAWLDNKTLYVDYDGQKQMVDMEVYEAVISPDGARVIYTKHTGGGSGDEGRTLFLYDPVLRLREPLFQFTDIIKDPVWILRDARNFILYTRGKGSNHINDTVVLFDLEPRRTLLTFPGSITGIIPGGGVSYMTYTDSGSPESQYDFYVDEFVNHVGPPDGSFAMASSQLQSSVNDYSPMRAFDGNYRTAWIEGAEGNGAGEWIEMEFPDKVNLKKIYIVTGFHKTHADFGDLFPLNARLKSGVIEFDGGKKVDVTFLDSKDPQLINLGPGITAKTVKLTVNETFAGLEWDDLCISEIMFEMG